MWLNIGNSSLKIISATADSKIINFARIFQILTRQSISGIKNKLQKNIIFLKTIKLLSYLNFLGKIDTVNIGFRSSIHKCNVTPPKSVKYWKNRSTSPTSSQPFANIDNKVLSSSLAQWILEEIFGTYNLFSFW